MTNNSQPGKYIPPTQNTAAINYYHKVCIGGGATYSEKKARTSQIWCRKSRTTTWAWERTSKYSLPRSSSSIIDPLTISQKVRNIHYTVNPRVTSCSTQTLQHFRSPDHKLVDTRVLEKRQKKIKTLKNVMFDSQVSLVNRSQGLEKKNKEYSRI